MLWIELLDRFKGSAPVVVELGRWSMEAEMFWAAHFGGGTRLWFVDPAGGFESTDVRVLVGDPEDERVLAGLPDEVDIVFDHGHRSAFASLVEKVRGAYVMELHGPLVDADWRSFDRPDVVGVHCMSDRVVVVEKAVTARP